MIDRCSMEANTKSKVCRDKSAIVKSLFSALLHSPSNNLKAETSKQIQQLHFIFDQLDS